eukprot:CAMPEP_0115137396 /NCGR_PEP_ID=MMETSP0227-20121206/57006_1 /TAXON_ID=89957 /ORGANISM="Polarella glacialis, Strain CCMP 1383" /LENGTH=379 /DNA_ID=CAMNT_0002544737 /DNA_START=124 /DNA_END=1264 /DNA_ORIENTATION=-
MVALPALMRLAVVPSGEGEDTPTKRRRCQLSPTSAPSACCLEEEQQVPQEFFDQLVQEMPHLLPKLLLAVQGQEAGSKQLLPAHQGTASCLRHMLPNRTSPPSLPAGVRFATSPPVRRSRALHWGGVQVVEVESWKLELRECAVQHPGSAIQCEFCGDWVSRRSRQAGRKQIRRIGHASWCCSECWSFNRHQLKQEDEQAEAEPQTAQAELKTQQDQLQELRLRMTQQDALQTKCSLEIPLLVQTQAETQQVQSQLHSSPSHAQPHRISSHESPDLTISAPSTQHLLDLGQQQQQHRATGESGDPGTLTLALAMKSALSAFGSAADAAATPTTTQAIALRIAIAVSHDAGAAALAHAAAAKQSALALANRAMQAAAGSQ